MSTFYAANYINGNGGTLTQSQYKTAIELTRSIMIEMPGGGGEDALTLSSFTITPSNTTGPTKVVDTQGGAGTDDLKTITPTNCRDGHILFIRSTSALRTVRVYNAVGGTGQILTQDGAHVSLTDPKQWVALKYKSSTTSWEEIFRSQNIDTFPIANVSANYVHAGPTSGGAAKPTWRAHVEADFGTLLDRLPGKRAATAVTLSTDSFTPASTHGFVTTITGQTTSDDLKWIDSANMVDGQFMLLRAASTYTITVRHNASGGAGTQRVIKTADGMDRVLQGDQTMLIFLDGTTLREWTGGTTAVAPGNLSYCRYFESAIYPAGIGATTLGSYGKVGSFTATASATTNGDSGVDLPSGGGNFINYQTSAVNGNVAKLVPSANLLLPNQGGLFAFRLRTQASIATIRLWAGLFVTTPEASDTMAGSECVAFRYSTGASDTTFKAYTNAGGVVDTGITVQTNTTYELVIDRRNPLLTRWYINGALVVESVTAPGTTAYGPYVTLTNLSAAAKAVGFGGFRCLAA